MYGTLFALLFSLVLWLAWNHGTGQTPGWQVGLFIMFPRSTLFTLPDALLAQLADFQQFEEIDSTNAEALRQLQAGATGVRLILANGQTAGRGRRGREWHSPAGAGIYLTLSHPFDTRVEGMQSLSLVTAISVRTALARCGVERVRLKWPNDLLVDRKKLAGILLELRPGQDQNYVVFGIGINVALPPGLPATIGQPVTDLHSQLEQGVDRSRVVTELLGVLLPNLQRFADSGFSEFREQWNQYDCYYNEDIVIQRGNHTLIGRSLGIDEAGALRLRTAVGVEIISGGEIFPSLRPAGFEGKP